MQVLAGFWCTDIVRHNIYIYSIQKFHYPNETKRAYHLRAYILSEDLISSIPQWTMLFSLRVIHNRIPDCSNKQHKVHNTDSFTPFISSHTAEQFHLSRFSFWGQSSLPFWDQELTPFPRSRSYPLSEIKNLLPFRYQELTPFPRSRAYPLSKIKNVLPFRDQELTPFLKSKTYSLSEIKRLLKTVSPAHSIDKTLFWNEAVLHDWTGRSRFERQRSSPLWAVHVHAVQAVI